MLEFLLHCTEELLLDTIIPKLRELLIIDDAVDMEPTLVDMTASQLMLTIGK